MFDEIYAVQSFAARGDLTSAQAYIGGIDDRIDHDPTGVSAANLWRVSAQALFEQDARIFMLGWHALLLAGCHVLRANDGDFEIKGLVKGRFVDHMPPRLVVYEAICDTVRLHGDSVGFSASVRVYPEGWRDKRGRARQENAASRRLFEELAFEADPAPVENDWHGDYFDKHLEESLEPGVKTYRNLTLRSSCETARLAHELLAQMRDLLNVPRGAAAE